MSFETWLRWARHHLPGGLPRGSEAVPLLPGRAEGKTERRWGTVCNGSGGQVLAPEEPVQIPLWPPFEKCGFRVAVWKPVWPFFHVLSRITVRPSRSTPKQIPDDPNQGLTWTPAHPRSQRHRPQVPRAETTQLPIEGQTDKQNELHSDSGTRLVHKKS